MATLCRNCGHALVFDPAIRKMHCTTCGSSFEAEEVESAAKKYREDERVLTRDEVFGDDEVVEDFLENYIYTCSECGGEIAIHGSEASTTCIYCGNPNVVFSRVVKGKMPDYIIPFSVTKEQALSAIMQSVNKAFLPPKEVKKIRIDEVRGIYLPYWIVNANHEEAAVVQTTMSTGASKYRYYGRTGNMALSAFPIDACRILSDDSSIRLEPFDLSKMKPFDEDYLLGFYSNASDITYDELNLAAKKRAKEIFDETIGRDCAGKRPKVVAEVHETAILPNYKYAMFPAWFVTFQCQGKPNTILVNGQTGKVVCGIPWNDKKFWWLSAVGGVLLGWGLTAALFMFNLARGLPATGKNSAISEAAMVTVGFGYIASVTIAFLGIMKRHSLKQQLKRTQSGNTFTFVKKRQE
ncbi:MAG: hypothetical protein J5379_11130 [Clostridiales bacterium]|nr:hypothetical protein [Clostridiales bacterium]